MLLDFINDGNEDKIPWPTCLISKVETINGKLSRFYQFISHVTQDPSKLGFSHSQRVLVSGTFKFNLYQQNWVIWSEPAVNSNSINNHKTTHIMSVVTTWTFWHANCCVCYYDEVLIEQIHLFSENNPQSIRIIVFRAYLKGCLAISKTRHTNVSDIPWILEIIQNIYLEHPIAPKKQNLEFVW